MATNTKVKPKSNAPLLIIGVVLVVAVLGGIWLYGGRRAAPANNAAGNANRNPAANSQRIPPNAPQGANPPNASGAPSAPVVIEEFADFQCPQCGTKHPVFNEIKSMYGSRVYFVFRHYPLAMHDKAYDASVAAEAAGLQGKFWDMQNVLFQNQKVWSVSTSHKQLFKDYAGRIGLDTEKWENDTIGILAKGRVDADLARARGIGVSGTPSVYINGVSLPFEQMTVEGIKAVVDAELAKGTRTDPAAPANAGTANASK
jgi:protein-disulfide isomerase